MTSNVTKQDVKLILESYKAWKNLNISLGNFASRTVNFPEAISESLACFNLGYEWHNKTQTKKLVMQQVVMVSWLKLRQPLILIET